MNMHCTNCGNPIEATSKFCSNCGTPAASNSVPVTSQPTYSFVVTGEIVDGQTLDAVKDNLEKCIKLDREKLDVIFAKKNVVLKKDIDKETAEKYKKAFAKCGAISNIIENVTNIITNDKSTDASTQPQQSKSNLSEAVDSENNPESTIDKENHSKISLWNPNAAANWSILFTPIFGAYLHSKNWAALGNKEKEKQSMYWAYGAIGVFILSLFLPGLGPAVSIGYLLGWYFSIAKMQAKHVKEELDNNYEKNNWLKPIGVASSCLFALIIVFSIAASNQGYSAKVASAQVQSSASSNPAATQDQAGHKKLRALALSLLDSDGPASFCDKIIKPHLKNVVYGTADAGFGGSTRFPAIFANYEGTCVKSMTGDQESISKWYVILAYDELGGMMRCLKVAGKPVVSSIAQDCSFKKT
jgi:hypothetical protein